MTENLTERDYEVLDACCELLSMKIDELKAENDKLKEILQEIKEIAEKVMLTELCNSCDGCGLIYGCNDTDCAYYQMDKILQKITKAEEE